MKKIILASKSPRRKELLSSWGVEFEIMVSAADESSISKSIPPHLYVQELSLLKASDVAKDSDCDCLIIGSDTIVEYQGEFLGKPKDVTAAKDMIKKLSGNEHRVYSGICVFDCVTAKAHTDYECTKVFFRNLKEEEIDAYVASGESMDKAGGYAIQGLGKSLVDHIEGEYENVVGLPKEKLLRLLKDEFDIVIN